MHTMRRVTPLCFTTSWGQSIHMVNRQIKLGACVSKPTGAGSTPICAAGHGQVDGNVAITRQAWG